VRTHYGAIDYLKALAIVAVAFQHAGFSEWTAQWTIVEKILRSSWTAFHVPTFLLVSGFLYYRRAPIGARAIAGRIRRLLVPYLVASLVVVALGLGEGRHGLAFKLATGSALGIYYFVFVLTICILSIGVLSRLPRPLLWSLLAVLVAYLSMTAVGQRFWLTLSLFWTPRDPLTLFWLGYFLIGWLVAADLPRLRDLVDRRAVPLSAAALAALLPWVALQLGALAPHTHILARAGLTACVVFFVVMFTKDRAVPASVRFLSEATLGIYLYHHVFQLLARPYLMQLPPAARVLALVAVGLGGAGLLCGGARRLDARRARMLLGA